MPQLKSGKNVKVKRGGIIGNMDKPRTVKQNSKLMQEELKQKTAQIEALLLNQNVNEVVHEPVSKLELESKIAVPSISKANVIGNYGDMQSASDIEPIVGKQGDLLMQESPDKAKQHASSMIPRSRIKKK